MLAAQTPATPNRRRKSREARSRILWRIRNGPNFAARTAPGVPWRREFDQLERSPAQAALENPVGPGWSSLAVAAACFSPRTSAAQKKRSCATMRIWAGKSGKRRSMDAWTIRWAVLARARRRHWRMARFTSSAAPEHFFGSNPVTGEIVWKKELTQVADSKVPMLGLFIFAPGARTGCRCLWRRAGERIARVRDGFWRPPLVRSLPRKFVCFTALIISWARIPF